MNKQKKQNHNKLGIDFFRKSGLAILFITLFCITGCEQLEENSGNLEINGKSYLLNLCVYDNNGMLEFYSSDHKAMVAIRLYNQSSDFGISLPTGTFKMENSKAPHITWVAWNYDDKYYASHGDDASATLKIKKHKDSYDEYIYNVTFKGNFAETNIKLTYKKNYRY